MLHRFVYATPTRFHPGAVYGTPGVLEAFQEAGVNGRDFLDRHIRGDWGCVCPEDAAANEQSLKDGSRLLSAYSLPITGQKVWIITEAQNDDGKRESTTLLLPEEY